MSSVTFASGRTRVVGRGIVQPNPIDLPPEHFRGAVVPGEDRLLHYATEDRWVALAPVLSTFVDAGNAATDYTGGAKIDLGSAQS